MRKKNTILILGVMLLVSIMMVTMVACKPGYKEVWEPVQMPSLQWENNGDIEIIRARIVESILDAELDVTNILDIAKDDGTFEGYDYYIKERTPHWMPLEHLRNVEKLQIAYTTPGNKHYQDPRIKDFVVKALKFWAEEDFYCDWSGWNNTIGLGLTVPNILLMDIEGLDTEYKDKLMSRIQSILMKNSKKRFKIYEREVDDTGGNLTDQVISNLKVACIENDGGHIMWLKSLLENELRPFPAFNPLHHRWDAEGPKEDYSFQQHDQLIYFGGYGEVFLSGMSRYMKFTKGTQYQLNDNALNFLGRFVVNGMQYSFRNEYRDISASGRGIARRNGLKGIYTPVKNIVNDFLEYIDNGYANLDKDVISGLNYIKTQRIDKIENGEKDAGAGGHRYFYESDYNAYNGDKYMATVRHASDRTRVFEYLNDENKLGYYTGLGATFYYVDGDEYYNLIPVYDWNKVPGTTTKQGRVPTMNQDFSYNTYGKTKYVSGVSNGNVGMSYFKMNSNGVKAKKAYFMFEDGVVCLGADISSWYSNEIVTNVNQAKWDGSVIVGANGSETTYDMSASSSIKKTNIDYIYHDKIAYFVDNKVSMSLDKDKAGDWNRVYPLGGSHEAHENLFTLDISHGVFPMDESYAYTLLMNTNIENTRTYAEHPTMNVVQNDKRVQAVYDSSRDVLEAVFYTDDSITFDGDRVLRLDGSAVVIVERINGRDVLTISSPDYETHKVVVSIGGVSKELEISPRPLTVEF